MKRPKSSCRLQPKRRSIIPPVRGTIVEGNYVKSRRIPPKVNGALDIGVTPHFAARAGDKWLADLCGLARRRLERAGLRSITGGDWCTFTRSDRFFSYRRDRDTGRMASLVWLAPR